MLDSIAMMVEAGQYWVYKLLSNRLFPRSESWFLRATFGSQG